MKKASLVLAVLVMAAPALAQGMKAAPAAGMVGALKASFDAVGGYIVRSAQEMPEADFAFKPTPEVRSFGQILGHVADSNNMICAAILGQPNPAPGIEKGKTSKADLVAALKASYTYCGQAYAMPNAEAGKTIKLFGHERPRFNGLLANATHNWEHYGNLVTYLRLKGMVPPSSQPKK
ncbi:MAG: hypothetical protein B7Z68_02350 [Acidobacteria bacterium 21-70-11]|nr:MAG: hypothetical protein B7Z68_02350 [Acidobacteria bacterium 21-70-11]OYW05921.1 MAG: hypothetical protein B7Z61_04485 [Acidobacteria bacterium 37-71-11]HQU33146.1 DinB family protein [Thermoanaerobaculaceae bacterium]